MGTDVQKYTQIKDNVPGQRNEWEAKRAAVEVGKASHRGWVSAGRPGAQPDLPGSLFHHDQGDKTYLVRFPPGVKSGSLRTSPSGPGQRKPATTAAWIWCFMTQSTPN